MSEPDRPTLAATTPIGGVVPRFDGAGLPAELWEDLRRAFEPRYQLRGLLGRGGMGVVIDAYDPVLERPLAIKILSPEALSDDPTARERLLREARAAATLSHPNVVSVFGVGETPVLRAPYILMQRIVGETLEQREEGRPLVDVVSATRLLGEVAGALSVAHGRGMVHRDLKPSNVMVDAQTGRAVVLDFGISHWTPTAGRQEAKLTGTGMYVGTPLYMSPEQAVGEPATEKSDIYSLGCLMYEVLTGRRVFDGESAMVVMAAHLKDAPTPLRTFRPEVPLALERTLMAMLAKDPAHRPSADDLRRQFAPVPESHPWGSARLSQVRGLLRSTAFVGIALGGLAALLVARIVSAPDARSSPRTTITTAIAVLLALVALVWAVQLFRAYQAAARAGLSWDLARLLTGDGAGEAGRIVDRLERFALLTPGSQRALLQRKRVLGAGLLLAGPTMLLMLWIGGLAQGWWGTLHGVESVAFWVPFLGLLLLKQRHDRLESALLGETALAIRGFRRDPVDPAITRWLTEHAALFGGPGGLRVRGTLAVIAALLVVVHVVVLGLVQFVATSARHSAIWNPDALRERYALVKPVLQRVAPPGSTVDPARAAAAWDSVNGIGVDTLSLAREPSSPGYWEHRALFPGIPGDSSSWGSEMFAATHGLTRAQREYLAGIARYPLLTAVPAAAGIGHSTTWERAIRLAARSGTQPHEELGTRGYFYETVARSLSRAALLAGEGRRADAEVQLEQTLRLLHLQMEDARFGFEWAQGLYWVREVDRALTELAQAGGGRGAKAPIRLPSRWTADSRADEETPVRELLADTTLPSGVRWGALWSESRNSCERPLALWTDRDATLDSTAEVARRVLARSATDSMLIDMIRADNAAIGKRVPDYLAVSWYRRAVLRLVRALGRTRLAGCLVVVL